MSAAPLLVDEPDWVDACALEDITPNTGVAALVGGRQIAIVRVGEGVGEGVGDGADGGAGIYAVDNFDPFSRAFVIARGIVGDRGGIPKIASPIFKQSFDLRTGQCLDDPAVRLSSYPVRVADGRIFVAAPTEAPAGTR